MNLDEANSITHFSANKKLKLEDSNQKTENKKIADGKNPVPFLKSEVDNTYETRVVKPTTIVKNNKTRKGKPAVMTSSSRPRAGRK